MVLCYSSKPKYYNYFASPAMQETFFFAWQNQHVRNAIEGTCMPVKSCLSLCDPKDYSSPGKNAGVGCHALFQGIYPTQGSNLSLTSPALVGGFFNTCVTWEAWRYVGESI